MEQTFQLFAWVFPLSHAQRRDEKEQRDNMEAVELGIDPREDVTFCSLKTSDPNQEGDPDRSEQKSPAQKHTWYLVLIVRRSIE